MSRPSDAPPVKTSIRLLLLSGVSGGRCKHVVTLLSSCATRREAHPWGPRSDDRPRPPRSSAIGLVRRPWCCRPTFPSPESVAFVRALAARGPAAHAAGPRCYWPSYLLRTAVLVFPHRFCARLHQRAVQDHGVVSCRRRNTHRQVDQRVDEERDEPAAFSSRRRERVVHERV